MARRKGRELHGILLLDKPRGLTSNQALQAARRLFDAKKAGHTGSLDPIATGLLPLCFGEATKVSRYLLESPKRYLAGIRLGVSTTTGDTEGDVVASTDCAVSKKQVQQVLESFQGEILQTPPMYSALKHQGQPLYKLAKQGIEVERQARPVSVYASKIVSLNDNLLMLDLSVSSGFYVRSLACDMGQMLGCGGHIETLRRTAVAGFDIESSVPLDQLGSMSGQERLKLLMPADRGISFLPPVELSQDAAYYLTRGQAVRVASAPDHGLVRLYDKDRRFIGIGRILDDGRVAPKRLLAA